MFLRFNSTTYANLRLYRKRNHNIINIWINCFLIEINILNHFWLTFSVISLRTSCRIKMYLVWCMSQFSFFVFYVICLRTARTPFQALWDKTEYMYLHFNIFTPGRLRANDKLSWRCSTRQIGLGPSVIHVRLLFVKPCAKFCRHHVGEHWSRPCQ